MTASSLVLLSELMSKQSESSCSRNLQPSCSKYDQCLLCKAQSHTLSRYATAGEEEKRFIVKHLGEALLPLDSLICKKHLIEAKRHSKTQGFIPKWKSNKEKILQKCINPNCTCLKYEKVIKPAFRPTNQIKEILNLSLSSNEEVVVCPKCYHDIYHLLVVQEDTL